MYQDMRVEKSVISSDLIRTLDISNKFVVKNNPAIPPAVAVEIIIL